MNNTVKNIVIGGLTLATLAIAASSALAGTGVTNRNTHRTTTGTGRVDFESVDNYSGVQVNRSQSLKMEANFGDVNDARVRFDGDSFSGSATSFNRRPVDPVAIGSFTSLYERLNVDGSSKAIGFESYSFTERMNEHNVESYSF